MPQPYSPPAGDLPITGPQQSPEPLLAAGDIYTVTNTHDNGVGSLRWALSFMTGGEIIRFDPILVGRSRWMGFAAGW